MAGLIVCTCEADSRACEIHPVHKGRRWFLGAALVAPLAAKLTRVLTLPVVLPRAVYDATTYTISMSADGQGRIWRVNHIKNGEVIRSIEVASETWPHAIRTEPGV